MRSMTHSKLHCDTAAGCNFETLFSVDWIEVLFRAIMSQKV